MTISFPTSYETARTRFVHDFEQLSTRWPTFRLESHPLASDPAMSIDCAWAEPGRPKTLVIISTGLHGIEGYAGAAMLQVFMEEFAPRLDPDDTGVLLVHAINPWGMQQRRRYNQHNVDLNRNFVWEGAFDPQINPDYEALMALLNPPRPIASLLAADLALGRLLGNMLKLGGLRVRQGTLSGQYRHPQGVQFGGQSIQEGTDVMERLFRRALTEYVQIIHLDMHTGYGPRTQMSVVNAAREGIAPAEWQRRLGYPLVVAANPDQFYAISGDMLEYFYQLRDNQYPDKGLYATCFEFGTLGDGLLAQIRSLRATVLENRLFHHGARSERVRQRVRAAYEELFLPSEPRWREKALSDCRQAMAGMLEFYRLV